MKHTSHLILVFLCFVFFLNIKAQERPPIKVFSPDVYSGENQNWMISQDAKNSIYIANNAGLLTYNGAKWQLYNSPNNTIMRSVKVIDDRIYTGCYMEFGYWKKDKFGILKYTSLVSFLNEKMLEDEQVWHILNLKDWVVFQTLNRIYFYNKSNYKFKVITSKNRITNIFKIDQEVYYQESNKGIFKLQNGVPKLIIKGSKFNNDLVINLISTKNGLLLITEKKGLFLFKENALKQWQNTYKKLSNVSIYSSIQLKDKSLLLGTISNGLIHLSYQGSILSDINLKNGLTNNTVLSLFEDIDGNVWAGLDEGINCINFKSPLRIFKDKEGLIGTVYTSKIFNNTLYLGTNQGLFYKKLDSKSEKFNFIKGTQGQVWCLEVIDNTLFCGHNLGTFIIDNNTAKLISDWQGTWQIKPIEGNENLIIQGNYTGLNMLEKINNKWQQRNKIKGFENSARFFEFISPYKLWVNHEYKGVFKLTLSDDYQNVVKYHKSAHVSKGKNTIIVKYKNQILYSSKKGIFKYNPALDYFVKDSLYSHLSNSADYISGKLVVDKNEKLWFFSKNNIGYISTNPIDNNPNIYNISLPNSLRKTMIGFENIIPLENNKYLLGVTNGYIKIDISKLIDSKNNIFINEVKLLNNKKDLNLNLNPTGDNTFNYKKNSFKFSYSIPIFDKYTKVEYQYKLEGALYNKWQKWHQNTTASFNNLPSGNYIFKVRARFGNTISQNVASYPFVINKPWYFTNIAWSIYILIILMLSYLVDRAYKKYYRLQKQRLIDINKKKIERSQLVSDKEIMFLKNTQLRKDIENKNRELAISTMSLIKKNELLSNLKGELKSIKEKPEVTSVIKIIDKNLNNNNDWEFFQDAFNNADKNFLNKVQESHPNLTPNDLRFCAYLRLNLSSKEIAPLLNISVRSVEIKRYRLRKKMNLPHQKSLVSYILEI